MGLRHQAEDVGQRRVALRHAQAGQPLDQHRHSAAEARRRVALEQVEQRGGGGLAARDRGLATPRRQAVHEIAHQQRRLARRRRGQADHPRYHAHRIGAQEAVEAQAVASSRVEARGGGAAGKSHQPFRLGGAEAGAQSGLQRAVPLAVGHPHQLVEDVARGRAREVCRHRLGGRADPAMRMFQHRPDRAGAERHPQAKLRLAIERAIGEQGGVVGVGVGMRCRHQQVVGEVPGRRACIGRHGGCPRLQSMV